MCLAIVATFHKVYTTGLHQVPIVPILNHKVYTTGLHQYSHSYEDCRRLAVAQPPIAGNAHVLYVDMYCTSGV